MTAPTIDTECPSCGSTFTQPFDPGKRREYCSNACRQRAYRARGGRASGSRQQSDRARERQAEQEAWAEQEARRERDRQRKARARGSRHQERTEAPAWTMPNSSDDAAQAKRRRTCNLLYVRAAHSAANKHEGAACRAKADAIRARYGL